MTELGERRQDKTWAAKFSRDVKLKAPKEQEGCVQMQSKNINLSTKSSSIFEKLWVYNFIIVLGTGGGYTIVNKVSHLLSKILQFMRNIGIIKVIQYVKWTL